MAIAAVAGLASVGGAMAAAGTFAIGFAAAATAFAIGAGLSIISRALMPKPDFGSMVNDSLTTTVREPASTRKVVYGKVRVGGSVVFITNSNANKNLYLVIAFAGHGIEDYESIWFNDQKVWENGSFLSNWGSYANFGIHKGFQSASDSVLTAASNDWTSTHVLNGIAYLRVRLVWDEDRKMFPNGVPNISAIIKGRKVYDPRKDSTSSVYNSSFGTSSHRLNNESTWEWSQNPALCIRDYLTNNTYGLGEANDAIDLQSISSVAGICEEQVSLNGGGTHDRYHCDGVVDTGQSIKNNIEGLVACMGGRVGYVDGKYFLQAAEYETPTVTITDEHMVGALTVQTKQSRRTVYNGVKGTFVSAEKNYIVADYPAKIDSSYAAEDGDPVYLDMPLPFVVNQQRAQRLAKIALQRSRQQTLVTVPLNLAALQFKAGDFINITNSRMGWTTKPFEVLDYTLDISASGSITVNVQCIETNSAVYDWTAGTDEDSYNEEGNLSTDDGTTVAAPTNLSLTETTDVARDGTATSSINVSYTASTSDFIDFYQARAFPTADTDDKSFVRTEDTSLVFRGLKNTSSGVEYKVRVRAVNVSGVKSAWVDGLITLQGRTTTPGPPTNLTVTGGIQSTTGSWTNPDVADFLGVEIWRANTSGGTYTHVATAGGNAGATQTFVDTNLPDATTRYYKFRAVSRSQNKSTYTTETSATTNAALSGSQTPREQSGYVYYSTSSASQPSTPTATSYSFSNGTFSGLSSGWQLDPVEQTGADGKYWASRFFVTEATHGGTQTVTFSTPFSAYNFNGLVTFTNLNTELADPSSTDITTIDGGHINTGLITLTGDSTAGMAVRLGKTSYTDTTSGFWLGNTGTSASVAPRFNIGGATKFLRFDGNDVEAKGILVKDTSGNTVFDADEVDGVYIKDLSVASAALANASITSAKIGALAVETAKIQDDAVTVPDASQFSATNTIVGTSNWQNAHTFTVDFGSGWNDVGSVIITAALRIGGNLGTNTSPTQIFMRLAKSDGTSPRGQVWFDRDRPGRGLSMATVGKFLGPSAQTQTYAIQVKAGYSDSTGGQWKVGNGNMVVVGGKK